jgi:hypothetical protein
MSQLTARRDSGKTGVVLADVRANDGLRGKKAEAGAGQGLAAGGMRHSREEQADDSPYGSSLAEGRQRLR